MKTINGGIDEKLFRQIVERDFLSPFHKYMDLKLLKVKKGKVRIEMIGKDTFLNSAGIVHGGATATLCDVAMGYAVRSLGKIPTTVEMKINYLSPALPNKKLQAVGNVIKSGSNLVVVEGQVYCDGKLIIKSLGTYFDLNNYGK